MGETTPGRRVAAAHRRRHSVLRKTKHRFEICDHGRRVVGWPIAALRRQAEPGPIGKVNRRSSNQKSLSGRHGAFGIGIYLLKICVFPEKITKLI
jgi:hypothetical protein